MDHSTRNESTTGCWRHPVCLLSFSVFAFLTPISFSQSSSDFENKFVCGEIMSYDDLHEHGSEAAVKAAGKLRQQGKPYESECLRSVTSVYRNS